MAEVRCQASAVAAIGETSPSVADAPSSSMKPNTMLTSGPAATTASRRPRLAARNVDASCSGATTSRPLMPRTFT